VTFFYLSTSSRCSIAAVFNRWYAYPKGYVSWCQGYKGKIL